MTDEVGNLVLEQLRQMRADMARIETNFDVRPDALEDDVRGVPQPPQPDLLHGNLTGRVEAIETRMGPLRKPDIKAAPSVHFWEETP